MLKISLEEYTQLTFDPLWRITGFLKDRAGDNAFYHMMFSIIFFEFELPENKMQFFVVLPSGSRK